MIEDKYSDTIGYIRFPITSSLDYEAISEFYRITGAVPYEIEQHPEEGCVVHLVRLRNLPSLIAMGLTSAPSYTVEYQTDSFEQGVTRLIIRDHEKQCVVRFERDFSGWSAFANEKPRLEYFTD
jgi:hypothetical protein